MIPFYLVLGHLLSDFLLQPSKLISYKEKHFAGILLHGAVHFAVSALLLFPYWNIAAAWWALAAICASHVAIDKIKIHLQKKTDRYVYPFLLDQFFHFAILYSVILLFKLHTVVARFPTDSLIGLLYANKYVWLFFVILIFCTAVNDIVRFQIQRERDQKHTFKFNTQNILHRLFLTIAVLSGFMLIGSFLR